MRLSKIEFYFVPCAKEEEKEKNKETLKKVLTEQKKTKDKNLFGEEGTQSQFVCHRHFFRDILFQLICRETFQQCKTPEESVPLQPFHKLVNVHRDAQFCNGLADSSFWNIRRFGTDRRQLNTWVLHPCFEIVDALLELELIRDVGVAVDRF